MTNPKNWKRAAGAAGLVATGLVAGGILAGTMSAGAATSTDTGTASSSSTPVDPSQPQRSDETLLTGDTKTSVEKAVTDKYQGATIERTETDSDGVYESHIVTSDGQHVTVQVDKSFAVTGTQTGGGGGGGHHGRPNDNDADDTGTSGSTGGA
jgi:hypothetical protein